MTGDTFDIVLSGGRVVDGCGDPWFCADVGVRGSAIALLAPPGTLAGRRVIDAGGLYVTPGFVDPHTHSDVSILQYPQADSVIRQGVTTHVTGNCGISAAPVEAAHRDDLLQDYAHYWDVAGVAWDWRTFAQYLRTIERRGTAINIVPLVGHGALRLAAMGFAAREPTTTEMAKMVRLLDASMTAGAHGMSTGLVYPPGCYATTAEIVELAKVVARHHGIYTSHIRGERETICEAIAEAIEIGRAAGLPVQVSHNAPKYGATVDASATLAMVEEARARGLDVTVDNDVHTDLAPRLSRALPQPVLGLGHEALMALLRDAGERPGLRRAVEEDVLPGPGYTGLLRHDRFDRIVILHAPRHPELRGRSVADIAAQRGRDGFDTFLDLIVEEDDQVVGIFDYIEESNIRRLLLHPLVMISSDGLGDAASGRARRSFLLLALQLWRVSWGAGALRARRAGVDARGGDPQDDLLPGPALWSARSRRAAAGDARRYRRLRPRACARPRHQPVPAQLPLRQHPARVS